MPAILGKLTIYFDDGDAEGPGEIPVAALTQATLSLSTEVLPGANPDGYGWVWGVPGTQRWSVSAGLLVWTGCGDARVTSQRRLERCAFDKTKLPVRFTTPYGAEYEGHAYIEEYEVEASTGAAMVGSFALRGVGELTAVIEEAGVIAASSGGQGDTTNTHYIGPNPGQIVLDYEMYSIEDQAQLIYDGEVVADTGGLVSGSGQLTYAYDGEAPYEIQVRIYAPTSSTGWDYVLRCPA